MKAEIVWRNPLPPKNDWSSIERITSTNDGAVYAVSKLDSEQSFELIPGRHGLMSGPLAQQM